MVCILLADDHDVVRRGLRHLIEEQPSSREQEDQMATCKARSAALTGNRTTAALLVVALLFAAPIDGRAQESGFEEFEPRPARDVVSGNLVEGPHYRLAPTVQTFAFQNHFVVSSDYGIFEAKSDAMLRRLVREIHAIGVLHDITLTDAYGKALGQAAMGPVRGVEALIAHPADTVAAVPTAVSTSFPGSGKGSARRSAARRPVTRTRQWPKPCRCPRTSANTPSSSALPPIPPMRFCRSSWAASPGRPPPEI
jgi:hypothetical protein